jgi:hypothetical protein
MMKAAKLAAAVLAAFPRRLEQAQALPTLPAGVMAYTIQTEPNPVAAFRDIDGITKLVVHDENAEIYKATEHEAAMATVYVDEEPEQTVAEKVASDMLHPGEMLTDAESQKGVDALMSHAVLNPFTTSPPQFVAESAIGFGVTTIDAATNAQAKAEGIANSLDGIYMAAQAAQVAQVNPGAQPSEAQA